MGKEDIIFEANCTVIDTLREEFENSPVEYIKKYSDPDKAKELVKQIYEKNNANPNYAVMVQSFIVCLSGSAALFKQPPNMFVLHINLIQNAGTMVLFDEDLSMFEFAYRLDGAQDRYSILSGGALVLNSEEAKKYRGTEGFFLDYLFASRYVKLLKSQRMFYLTNHWGSTNEPTKKVLSALEKIKTGTQKAENKDKTNAVEENRKAAEKFDQLMKTMMVMPPEERLTKALDILADLTPDIQAAGGTPVITAIVSTSFAADGKVTKDEIFLYNKLVEITGGRAITEEETVNVIKSYSSKEWYDAILKLKDNLSDEKKSKLAFVIAALCGLDDKIDQQEAAYIAYMLS